MSSSNTSRYADVHANPKGPGDERPTALQIVKDQDLLNGLKDHVFFVTGCASGIGLETVRALHATGATVFATGRELDKTQAAIDEIFTKDPENKAPIHVIHMELDSFESIKAGVAEFHKKSSKLNVLINNAVAMSTQGNRTTDGFEYQFGTNHLGHFLLFQLLKPTLLASSTPQYHSRVINLSSVGHRMGPVRFDDLNFEKEEYNPWAAFGQTKTADIYMANHIERLYGKQGLHAISLHAGGIDTGTPPTVNPTAPAAVKEVMTSKEVTLVMKSLEQGAATTVYAAIGKEFEGKGGFWMSNCAIQEAYKGEPGSMSLTDDGYAEWAFNEEGEKKLWEASVKMVGVGED